MIVLGSAQIPFQPLAVVVGGRQRNTFISSSFKMTQGKLYPSPQMANFVLGSKSFERFSPQREMSGKMERDKTLRISLKRGFPGFEGKHNVDMYRACGSP